jgi:hypothetical protein
MKPGDAVVMSPGTQVADVQALPTLKGYFHGNVVWSNALEKSFTHPAFYFRDLQARKQKIENTNYKISW